MTAITHVLSIATDDWNDIVDIQGSKAWVREHAYLIITNRPGVDRSKKEKILCALMANLNHVKNVPLRLLPDVFHFVQDQGNNKEEGEAEPEGEEGGENSEEEEDVEEEDEDVKEEEEEEEEVVKDNNNLRRFTHLHQLVYFLTSEFSSFNHQDLECVFGSFQLT